MTEAWAIAVQSTILEDTMMKDLGGWSAGVGKASLLEEKVKKLVDKKLG